MHVLVRSFCSAATSRHYLDVPVHRIKHNRIPLPLSLPAHTVDSFITSYALQHEWQIIPQRGVQRLIASMRRRCQAVTRARGGPNWFWHSVNPCATNVHVSWRLDLCLLVACLQVHIHVYMSRFVFGLTFSSNTVLDFLWHWSVLDISDTLADFSSIPLMWWNLLNSTLNYFYFLKRNSDFYFNILTELNCDLLFIAQLFKLVLNTFQFLII